MTRLCWRLISWLRSVVSTLKWPLGGAEGCLCGHELRLKEPPSQKLPGGCGNGTSSPVTVQHDDPPSKGQAHSTHHSFSLYPHLVFLFFCLILLPNSSPTRFNSVNKSDFFFFSDSSSSSLWLKVVINTRRSKAHLCLNVLASKSRAGPQSKFKDTF